jgi:hypothetical protein
MSRDAAPCHHACVNDSVDPTAEAIERSRHTLGQMSELVGDRGHHENPRRWDRLIGEWMADRSVLEGTDEGRAAIGELMSDSRPTVRLWSAAAALFWDPETARAALTEIRDAPMRYDLHSITAKHTLLEFDAGRLDRDAALPGSQGSSGA